MVFFFIYPHTPATHFSGQTVGIQKLSFLQRTPRHGKQCGSVKVVG
jgi:hypothetical protein